MRNPARKGAAPGNSLWRLGNGKAMLLDACGFTILLRPRSFGLLIKLEPFPLHLYLVFHVVMCFACLCMPLHYVSCGAACSFSDFPSCFWRFFTLLISHS